MFLIRESVQDDIDQILIVAKYLDSMNLPADREQLRGIVRLSKQSFAGEVPVSDREFLFVLEHDGKVVGTSMIHAQHGSRRSPHVYLQVMDDERYSTTLDRYMVHQCLRLGFNYDGPTEIGGLTLSPDYRGHPSKLGKQLSYVRFLFISMHRELFRDTVLSELMPPLEEDGTSRLWKHFGKRFTGLSYREADKLSRTNKEFIWALFPHGLIYTPLFPERVRDDIGKVGPHTVAVKKMLQAIGFRYANQIDPFDGGPHFIANTDDISLVKNSRPVELRAATEISSDGPLAILACPRRRGMGFRALATHVSSASEPCIDVPEAELAALGFEAGDPAWAVML